MRLKKILTVVAATLLGAVLLPAQNQVSVNVNGTMDIYRAGGYNDASDGIAPVVFSFPPRVWRTMSVPAVGGAWSCLRGYPDYGADGESSGYCVTSAGPLNFDSVGPFSGYHLTDFVGGLAGVFLEDELPASAPRDLRFYVNDNSDGGIQTDFESLAPRIGKYSSSAMA